MKTVIFLPASDGAAATAPPDPVAAGERICVVTSEAQRRQLLRKGTFQPDRILVYSAAQWLLLWVRLLRFLGVSRGAQIRCHSGPNHGALKLLALALRGRALFTSPSAPPVSLSLPHFLWVALKTAGRRRGDICLVGTAGNVHLERLLTDLRRRYPEARITALVPPGCAHLSADETAPLSARSLWRAGRRRPRFATVVIPCTGDGRLRLKVLAWLLPLGYREIYNENYDYCSAREVHRLARHAWWRVIMLVRAVPDLRWRIRLWLTRRPERITVLGSASGLYLKTIVADLRRRRPLAKIHALLPASLVTPIADAPSVTGLFDSHTVLRPFSARFWWDLASLVAGRRRSGYLVIPCTNESNYNGIKLGGFWLPLGLREVYNENGDAYMPRQLSMMLRHTFWRLRHRIFYQALTERRGRPWPLHAIHLLLYPARLFAGAVVLMAVRARAIWARPPRAAKSPAPAVTEEVLAVAKTEVNESMIQ